MKFNFDKKHLNVIANAMKNWEKLAGSALKDLEGGYERVLEAAKERVLEAAKGQEDHR